MDLSSPKLTREIVEKFLRIPYERYREWNIDSSEIKFATVDDTREVNRKLAIVYTEIMDTQAAIESETIRIVGEFEKAQKEARHRLRIARAFAKTYKKELSKPDSADAIPEDDRKRMDISDITPIQPSDITSDDAIRDISTAYAYKAVPNIIEAKQSKAIIDRVYAKLNDIAKRADENLIGLGTNAKIAGKT